RFERRRVETGELHRLERDAAAAVQRTDNSRRRCACAVACKCHGQVAAGDLQTRTRDGGGRNIREIEPGVQRETIGVAAERQRSAKTPAAKACRYIVE